jgi:hypothetical protein
MAAPVLDSVALRSMARGQALALILLGTALSLAMPVFGVSLLLFLVLEVLRLSASRF